MIRSPFTLQGRKGEGLFKFNVFHYFINLFPGRFRMPGDQKVKLDLIAAVKPSIDSVAALTVLPINIIHFHTAEKVRSGFRLVSGVDFECTGYKAAGIGNIDGKRLVV